MAVLFFRARGETHIIIPPDAASLLLLSNGSANLFDAPIVPMAGLLIADGVILAVNPPSGENRPYAFGDSQGKTNHGAQQGICREYVSIFLN